MQIRVRVWGVWRSPCVCVQLFLRLLGGRLTDVIPHGAVALMLGVVYLVAPHRFRLDSCFTCPFGSSREGGTQKANKQKTLVHTILQPLRPKLGVFRCDKSRSQKAQKRERKEAKGAAIAASLVTSGDVSESEVDSNLPPSSYLAAARYNSKLARELAPANPEAAALLGPKSRDFTNKAMLARPLSKQVSLLQQKVSAKQAEEEKLVQQIPSAQRKLQEVNREGAELSNQLDAVRACLAAGLGTSPGASSAPVTDFSAIWSALNHMANLLPVEMGRSLFTGLLAGHGGL